MRASQPLKTFCLAYGNSSAKTINLRWFVSSTQPVVKDGFTILRKKHGSPMIYQIVGTTTSSEIKNSSLENEEAQIADSVISLAARISRSTQVDPLHVWSLQYLNCVVPGTVSKILGLQFVDTSVRVGIVYDYRIDIGTTTIATLLQVSTNTVLNPSIEELRFEETSRGVKLFCNQKNVLEKGIVRWKIVRQIGNQSDTLAVIPRILVNDNKDGMLFYDIHSFKKNEKVSYLVWAYDLWGNRSKVSSVNFYSKGENVLPAVPSFTEARSKSGVVFLKWDIHSIRNIERFRIYRSVNNERVLLSGRIPPQERSCSDTILKPNSRTISYNIVSVDSLGREGDFSPPVSVVVDDTIAPRKPSYIVVQYVNKNFELLWNRSSEKDVVGYEVTRSIAHENRFGLLNTGSLSDSVFMDTTLRNVRSGMYMYKVRALDMFGNRSEWTEPVTIAIPDLSIPASPVLTDIKGTDKSIELRWQRISDDDLAGYWINRTDDTLYTPITLNEVLLPGDKTTYSDSSVKAGVLYYYQIVSVDSSLNISSPSQKLSARSYDTRMPMPPIVDSVYSAKDQITITWFFEFQPPIPVSVVVERSRDGKRYVQISAPLNEKVLKFIDSDISKGERYYYRLRSITSEGSIGKPSENRTITLKE